MGFLDVENLTVCYNSVKAVTSVFLSVNKGEIAAVFGTNGSGKTTLLKGIVGLLPVKNGKVVYNGGDITNNSPQNKILKGIVYTPERAQAAGRLTVKENLILGGYVLKKSEELKERLNYVYQLFPVLFSKKDTLAGSLSGGEKQMLVLGRGLMSNPVLLLMDEPLLGLSPLMKRVVIELFLMLKERGLTLLLSEHDIESALEVIDKFYVIRSGEIKRSGKGDELKEKVVLRNLF